MPKDASQKNPWLIVHPLGREDSLAVAGLRTAAAASKGKFAGIAARGPFNGIMEQVAAPAGVTFTAETVGGISGWWVKPPEPRRRTVILHLHGGWFNWGSAQAYRNLVGHIALNSGDQAFIPDYRLAPEHPFPAAVHDCEACYDGLIERGLSKVAITGDSAGGNLALVLLAITSSKTFKRESAPVGGVAISPLTDLALTGESFDTRAEADPFFTKSQAAGLVGSYLAGSDAKNPMASPLYGDLHGLPPIRVHVGDDEVLLDDSRRYVERAVAAGVDAKLDLWMGMPHGFVTGVGAFKAAAQAFQLIGGFLRERLD